MAQAYVVGLPDPARDEVLAAVIVPCPGPAPDAAALAAHCAGALASYKVPRALASGGGDGVAADGHRRSCRNRLAELFASD